MKPPLAKTLALLTILQNIPFDDHIKEIIKKTQEELEELLEYINILEQKKNDSNTSSLPSFT